MRKSILASLALLLALTGMVLFAQTPQTPAAGGRGGGRGMMGPAPVAAPQPLMDWTNNLVAAINKQDADAVKKMIASDAVYLDEDGHSPAVARWIAYFTDSTKPKTLTIKMVAGNQPEKTAQGAMTSDSTGWVSFYYTFPETTAQGKQITVTGTCSMVLKKMPSGDWQAVLIHGAITQKIAGITDGGRGR